MTRRLEKLVRMAWRDLADEWTVSLAVCLAITAVAAPILVLLGLYAGVLGQIFTGLSADPAAREIRLQATGSARFDPAWFDELRTMPEVAFVVPATRFASTQVQVFDSGGTRERRANLLPTGRGDPLFPAGAALPAEATEAAISAPLADALSAVPGDMLTIEVTRKRAGQVETAFATVTVTAIARAADYQREALFVTLNLLTQIEDFKDGKAAPVLQAEGDTPAVRSYYPDFRLYAGSIDDVAPLTRRLSAEPYNLSLQAQTARIGFAKDLARSLQLVIGAIAALGVLGLAGGLATIQWSMAARRRRTIAVLSLIGFSRAALIGFPVIQAVLLASFGAVLTVLAALGFAALINLWLADALGGGAARIEVDAALAVSATIVVISVIPALLIGVGYAKLEPGNEIRET